MKTIKYLAIAVAALAASSCLNESAELPQTEGTVFTALFADDQTKVLLKPGTESSTVEWEATDHVSILAGESNWDYKADAAGATTNLLPVDESAAGTQFYALCPYEAAATLAEGVITATLPAEQTAVLGSFAAHMAVAYTETNALAFKNVCGLVKVRVASEGVTKVVFEGKADENVAGKIAVTVADAPTWAATAESSKTVALVAEEGKTLEKGDYYLATLPQRFQSGFTVKVYKGETLAQTKEVSGDLTLERCQVVPGTVGFDVEGIAPTIATVGETITVTGYGFTADTKVKINGAEAAVTVTSSSSLAVTVPEGLTKATDYKLTVEVPGFDAVETAPFRYFYLPVYELDLTDAVGYIGAYGNGSTLDGTGTAARFHTANGVALASDGSLWVTTIGGTISNNNGHAIRKVNPTTKEVTTLIEPNVLTLDGTQNIYPYHGAFASNGDYYVACKNGKFMIGKVAAADNAWTTFVCTDTPEKAYSAKNINFMNLLLDSSDNIYVCDRDQARILKVNPETKAVTETIALKAVIGGEENNIQVNHIAWGKNKQQFIVSGSDDWRIVLCELNGNGVVIAGNGNKPHSPVTNFTDGDRGNPLTAAVGQIGGIYYDETDEYIYFNDINSKAFRVLVPGVGGDYTKGMVKTLLGNPSLTASASGGLSNLGGLVKMPDGTFYLAANKAISKASPVTE